MKTTNITYLTRKGQTTIPVEIRRALDLQQGQALDYSLNKKDGVIEIRAIPPFESLLGVLKTNIKWDKKKAQKAMEEGFVEDYKKKLKRIDGHS
ncbi:MAG: Looped-hinge helix DNA binding domain, AbrB family [Berkelbacteria bacterium GW2011_GWA2_46_7]|uniref:Looped-hinge helix DNA binding domain, AbrB family n=1 Tax=Berkelbacteria bacterium GW2011_GWA2_46_7 TaxID=1618335 RepID=A0A0G1SQW8_9BACT|nr:MAG: Looped-hinge helix DNA binding domain, AbrB family [Berkelbacteria bacterium GW2011_GWA2_46_7]